MSSLTTTLKLEPIDKDNLPTGWHMGFTLMRSFEYHIGTKNSGYKIRVPKGFQSNFVSAPRWSWPIVAPYSPTTGKASLCHDYMYEKRLFSRLVCDSIFHEMLIVLGTPKWKADLMFWAVRLGGKKYYYADTRC